MDTPIFQLKITLQGIKPPIWRRFLIPADTTFDMLHHTIQIVMGWYDSHLYQFDVNGTPIVDGRVADELNDSDVLAEEAHLDHYLARELKPFTYEYDFGDSWSHRLVLEKVLPAEPNTRYPRCLGGARRCPPEDVGGVWGYETFLEALRDPKHADHETYTEWYDGPFDPEHFDPGEVNQKLGMRIRSAADILAVTPRLTRPAQAFWDALTGDNQAGILLELWCYWCGAEGMLGEIQGKMRKGTLVLRATCSRCGNTSELTVEDDGH
jgi:hypothetical protein